MQTHPNYRSSFSEHDASQEMRHLFSAQFKYATWRKLRLALAQGEQSLGVEISNDQIDEMKAHLEKINFDRVAEYEKKIPT